MKTFFFKYGEWVYKKNLPFDTDYTYVNLICKKCTQKSFSQKTLLPIKKLLPEKLFFLGGGGPKLFLGAHY
jgi:hypothetical protein